MLDNFIKRGGQIHFNHTVTDFSQNAACAQVKVTDKETGKTVYFQGDYLLAADGAHSTIRQLLNIPMIGPAEMSTVFSVYCEMDLSGIFKREEQFSIAFIVRPEKPAPMVLSIDGENQWIFVFPSAGASVEALKTIYTDDYIRSEISDVIGKNNIPITILSKNAWSLGSQVANQFQAGRTFLLGDSVHRFLPTGGMGMNSGLQDADNLMWKLAYVIKGYAKKSILKTYEIERMPIILRIMQLSLENLQRIVQIRREFNKNKGKVDFQALVQKQEAHLNKSGLDLGSIYSSDLIAATDEKKPAIPADRYISNAFPGARLPHFKLIKNNTVISSLDLLSTNFIFLFYEKHQSLVSKINFETINTIFIPIGKEITEMHPGEFLQWVDNRDNGAILVRPDGHIAWKGSLDDLNDLKKLLDYARC